VLPRRYLPVAVAAAIGSYLAWVLAGSDDYAGKGVLTLAAAAVFWLSVMALAAYAVQAGVDRYRQGHDHDRDRRRR
jgi:hypothetical protein